MSKPQFRKAFADYIERILSKPQSGQFLAVKPADFGSVAGGGEISRNPAAQKINQNVVILHAQLGIAQDAVVDAEKFARLDGKPGFFANLADSCIAHQFADLEGATWNRPLRLQWRVRTFDEEHVGIFDDDGSNADQGDLGEFTLHGEDFKSNRRLLWCNQRLRLARHGRARARGPCT